MKLEKLLTHYSGEIAEGYESGRKNPKWAAEQSAVSELLHLLPRTASILDVPVGTGRFIPVYEELDLRAIGMDISVDMLGEAQKKIRKNDGSIVLRSGDVRRIDARVESVDCVVCIRFLNWVDTPLLAEILGELCRVSKTNLIVGIRHLVPIGNYKPFKSVQGMLCAIRQISRLIYRKNELVLHRKSQVDNILSGLGLRVVQTKVIERDKRGTSYNIYLLEK